MIKINRNKLKTLIQEVSDASLCVALLRTYHPRPQMREMIDQQEPALRLKGFELLTMETIDI